MLDLCNSARRLVIKNQIPSHAGDETFPYACDPTVRMPQKRLALERLQELALVQRAEGMDLKNFG